MRNHPPVDSPPPSLPGAPCLTAIFLLLALTSAASAQTTRLVPSQYPTIQSAIAAAANGDTVFVAPGVYAESINYLTKDLKVISAAGAAFTTIKGNFASRVVTLGQGSPPTAVLDGFTIQDGDGGVLLDGNSATVRNCVIRNNVTTGNFGGAGILINCHANQTIAPNVLDCQFIGNYSAQSGGGIFIDLHDNGTMTGTCLPTIQRCTFRNNFAQGAVNNSCNTTPCRHGGGGAVSLRKHNTNGTLSLLMTDCVVENNAALTWGGAANFEIADSITLRSCRFTGNSAGVTGTGGAITATNCSLDVISCLFAGNSSPVLGGAIYARSLNSGATMTLNVIGSTITNNSAPQGGGIATGGWPNYLSCSLAGSILRGNLPDDLLTIAPVTATYCCLGPGPAIGSPSNVNLDPLFLDPGTGDYHLSRFSPLIDAGDPFAITGGINDLDGTARLAGARVDIGADEVPAAALLGSGEDLELHGFRHPAGDPQATTLTLTAGDVLVVRLLSVGGGFVGANPLVVGQPYTTGFPPMSPPGLPGVHLDGFMLQIVYGATANGFLSGTTLAPGGVTLYYAVPPGLGGYSYRLQGFAVSPLAANGAYAVTEAHDLVF